MHTLKKTLRILISLTEMRTHIHTLQPQDLEFPIPEKTTSDIGNDGPKEDVIEDCSGYSRDI